MKSVDVQKNGPRESNILEGKLEPWDGKEAPDQYARRARAASAGRLLLSASLNKEGKKGKGNDLADVLKEKNAAIEGLHAKKKALAGTRENYAEKIPEFKKAEKALGYSLKNFDGEKSDLLLTALDNELNPERKKPLKQAEQKNAQRALKEFDERTEPAKHTAMHLAAYIYLKQGKIAEGENQIWDIQDKAAGRGIDFQVKERNFVALLNADSGLARSLNVILRDERLSDKEKIRAIDDALSGLQNPQQREAAEGYLAALQSCAAENNGANEMAKIRGGIRDMQEAIDRAQQRQKMERDLQAAGIPAEKKEN